MPFDTPAFLGEINEALAKYDQLWASEFGQSLQDTNGLKHFLSLRRQEGFIALQSSRLTALFVSIRGSSAPAARVSRATPGSSSSI